MPARCGSGRNRVLSTSARVWPGSASARYRPCFAPLLVCVGPLHICFGSGSVRFRWDPGKLRRGPGPLSIPNQFALRPVNSAFAYLRAPPRPVLARFGFDPAVFLFAAGSDRPGSGLVPMSCNQIRCLFDPAPVGFWIKPDPVRFDRVRVRVWDGVVSGRPGLLRNPINFNSGADRPCSGSARCCFASSLVRIVSAQVRSGPGSNPPRSNSRSAKLRFGVGPVRLMFRAGSVLLWPASVPSSKLEARSSKLEARSLKLEARSSELDARRSKLEA